MDDRQQALEPGLPEPVPVGEFVDLGARGRGFVRITTPAGEIQGSADASGGDPVLLLHGLTASGGINWVHLFGPLGADRIVIAPDLRGHARGPRAPRRFDMADNAADVIALLDGIGVGRVSVIGFSMGGAVAQELARGWPDRVGAMVLVSSAARFGMAPIGTRLYGANAVAARAARRVPSELRERLSARFVAHPDAAIRRFVVAETARHTASGLVRSAKALGRFSSSPWLADVEVPTTVVVATADRSLSPRLQQRLAACLAAAEVVEAATGHAGVIWDPERAVPAVLDGLSRAEARRARSSP